MVRIACYVNGLGLRLARNTPTRINRLWGVWLTRSQPYETQKPPAKFPQRAVKHFGQFTASH